MSSRPGQRLDTPDHRELGRMLDRLTPVQRVWFVGWCCERASERGVSVRVTEHTGTVGEAYQDLLLLDAQYGFSLDEARRCLDEFLRRV